MQRISRTLLVLFTLSFKLNLCKCSRLLAIFPIPLKEQQLVYRPLIEQLAHRGHHITVLTTDTISNTSPIANKIEQIDLSFVYQLRLLENLNGDGSLDGSDMLKSVFDVLRKIAEAELGHESVQRLIQNQTESFDAVIVEWAGMTLMNAFAHKFQAPLIGITPAAAFLNSHEALGNPNHPIGYPSIFMPFSENLTILQKISSFMFTIWYRFYYFNEELPRQEKILHDLFNDVEIDLWEIERKADLLLINSYQMLGNVRATVPTTVYLGGLHQSAPRPLSQDLNLFIAQSSGPLVYVNVDASICMNSYRLAKLLNAIEFLDIDVIWRWNGGDMVNSTARIYHLTDNVSEDDVLANNKVELFVTSGGQRHIENAIHHNVPVLGLSVTTQLEHYLHQITKFEAGAIAFVDFETKQSFIELVQSTIRNSTYIDNMSNLNRLLLDQPISSSSVERACWWIEYVLRNGGTKHIQSTMKNLTWYEYLLIDVVVTIVVIFAIVLCSIAFVIQRLRDYSKSLPFEMVTRGSKCKVL